MEIPMETAEIKLEPEDSPEILPSPLAQVSKPHSSKQQTKQTSWLLTNLPDSSHEQNMTKPTLSKRGTKKEIPTSVKTVKRCRDTDSSKEESSGMTRRGAVTRGAKHRKDVPQERDDSDAEDDPDYVAGFGESDDGDFSDSETSWEGSSNGSEDDDIEDEVINERARKKSVPSKTSATRAKKASCTITRPQEPEDSNNENFDQNRLLAIFLNPRLVVGEGAVEESDIRDALKCVPENVPIATRNKTEQGSVQKLQMVLSSGDGSVKTYNRSKELQTVVRGNATECNIIGDGPATKIKVEPSDENSFVDVPQEGETELCLVETKDETIEVTETTIQGYDTGNESQNLLKRFSEALTETLECLTSKANALEVLRFILERADLKTTEDVMYIFAESLTLLEVRPAKEFAKDNGQTVESNARCIVKQIYDTAVVLRDKCDQANKVVNFTADCKVTLQHILSGTVQCMDIGTSKTKNRKPALGDSSQAGSEATDKDLDSSALGMHQEPLACCDSCGMAFDNLYKMEIHRAQKHSGTGPFTCYSCGKVWPTKEKLLDHIRYHGPKIHKCDICGNDFCSASKLNEHMKAHTGQFQCHICGRNLSNPWSLKHHLLIHERALPHRCAQCGKLFRKKGSLTEHRRDIHSDSQPYQCEVCSKTFTLRHSYRQHVQTHMGRGTHRCDICQRMFASKRTLHDHHRYVHQGVRHHKCEECGHEFVMRKDLTRHMAVHTGEAKFQCEFCQKRFTRMGNLNRHRATHMTEGGLNVTAVGDGSRSNSI